METGVYQIEFFDGSKWNLYFANSTQHKNTLRNIKENEHLIKSFELIVSGIHTSKQIEQVFNEIKNRKKPEKFARKDTKTGKGMNEGFCFGDGEAYFEEEEDAETHAISWGYKNLKEAYRDEAYYFTEWEVEEGETWYGADGNEFNK